MTHPSLISVEWLKDRVASGDLGQVVILDVSWSSSKDMREHYNAEHVPGAVYLSTMEGKHTDMFPRNIPDADAFQESVRAAGVDADSHVIVYSDSDACGFFLSGRAWWTFKVFGHKDVSILDGGWQKWKAAGGQVTSDVSTPKKGNFICKPDDGVRLTYETMEVNMKESARQVCDSRPSVKYSGEDSTGHIKGAKNLPMSELVNPQTGTLKDLDQIKKEFSAAGVDLSKPLACYCNSGMSSCTLAFTAALCGNENVSVYHGGFNEWSKRSQKDQIEK
ncbi:thiosulfate sulfurtransferase-like [Mizuhopecten yessoensis]|uniref:Thiosulfate sulfurtransferase n=1 Tax=Mizuhopecten yessoensis TaxID=6573 RepID=A0A210Q824_MIZYE|nr:thiosulfate sulfurtransferase-like [Mizuhopecten yessoensis]XP_021364773.1 thiosulfate sulfurtransferase-like [Mizuhopecten yessoensis]XP_021364774.1 thiosulfate sulfurtransferase-like [Mizuhopecten yessoensis]XP_021364775.1 thiosulfate sulfurtransferase-like [Mizuhopecten yessoensis]OWF44897.1 Thiosulfate sulfurtransferase [Mizuhopecten yessoensis]